MALPETTRPTPADLEKQRQVLRKKIERLESFLADAQQRAKSLPHEIKDLEHRLKDLVPVAKPANAPASK